MQKNFLKDIIVIAVGKHAEPIADLLDGTKYVNEFLIAKKLDITINQTRNILYKLADFGLVSSTRKKDKKKGWYTYFWKIEILKSLLFLEDVLVKREEQLKNQIKSRETKVFYVCENCNIEYTEENAIIKDFTCDECGNVFTLKDNSKVLKEFSRALGKIQDELVLVRKEIDSEKGKIDKVRQRDARKVAKKKEAERKLKREERAKLKKDLAKSDSKKAKKKVGNKVKKVVKKKTATKKRL